MKDVLTYEKAPSSSYKRVGKKLQKTLVLDLKEPKKTKVIHVRCSEQDWVTLKRAAKDCGNTLSAWMLFKVLKAVE